jgi:2-C-methyl-D-erythritol 4-phosphate cytidylyltransferase
VITAVVLAAGHGARFGRDENKVWALLAGRPLLGHALDAFARCGQVDEIVVVARDGEERQVDSLARGLDVPTRVVLGGERRSDSAQAGLSRAHGEYVLIHDGARPFPCPDLIRRVLAAARIHGAAVPVLPVTDTVRYGHEGFLRRDAVGREGLVHVQTPQGFRRDLLVRAYAAAERQKIALPDDAAAVLAAGHAVATVQGDPGNVKITYPEDLALAERLLAGSTSRPAPISPEGTPRTDGAP